MKLAIQKNNGQWWSGACWGVEQAREVYDSVEDLPEEIEGATKEVFQLNSGALEIQYLAPDEADDAGVVGI